MKALTLQKIRAPLVLEERPELEPAADQVIVQLKTAALNRRDYWITQGLYPGIKPPVVLGSDGAGIVIETGSSIGNYWRGREVIINPGLHWGDDPKVQSADFTVLGVPHDGTFATTVAVSASQLHPKPDHLDWPQAAALPLAGVTAYRALFTQGGLQSGQTVLITGIGGGVATFALQMAVAVGGKVWVTSSSSEKIAWAVELGALGGLDYRDENWSNELVSTAGPPNLIIDSAGGEGYGALTDIAAPGARIVNYGATAGPPDRLDLFKVFWKQLRIQGSTMGSPDDFAGMLQLVEQHQIRPVIDRQFPLAQGDQAVAMMRSSPQFGKYVLTIE